MNKINFVTGASGSGKTTIVKELEQQQPRNVQFFYFDSIGVPSAEEMNRDYGSGKEWQRQTTIKLAKTIRNSYLANGSVILDGQMKLDYVVEACKENDIQDYSIILVDCEDEERFKRLVERGHPELANQNMLNWAKYLRNEAVKTKGAVILDTTGKTVPESTHELALLLQTAEK